MLAHGVLPIASIGYGYPLLHRPDRGASPGRTSSPGCPRSSASTSSSSPRSRSSASTGSCACSPGAPTRTSRPSSGSLFPVAVIHYFLADYHARYVDITLPSAVGPAPARRLPVDGAAARRRVLHAPRRVVRAMGRRARGRVRGRPRRGGEAGEPALPAGAVPRAARRPAVPRARRRRRRDGSVAPRDDRLEAARPRRPPAFASSGDGRFALAAVAVTLVGVDPPERAPLRPARLGPAPSQPRRAPRVHLEPADDLLHRRRRASSGSCAARLSTAVLAGDLARRLSSSGRGAARRWTSPEAGSSRT